MTEPATIPRMFRSQVRKHWNRTMLRAKKGGHYADIPWSQLGDQVEKIALGLMDLGVRRGDRVAILSENRPEWVAADLSILSLGAVTVPVYTTLTTEEIGWILRDSGAHVVFTSAPDLMTKLVPIQEKLGLKVVLFEAPYRVMGPRVWWLGELVGLGQTASRRAQDALSEAVEEEKPDDLASIIYTSGTTGNPKGVMLTHDNFLSNCRAIQQALPLTDADSTLSFLPLSHVFERCAGYYFVLFIGGTISYAENMETVGANLLEVRPTLFTAVPRFYEKLYARIQETVQKSPPLKRKIFRWAERLAIRRVETLKKGASLSYRIRYAIAERLVFHKLRSRLGGRLRFCISGSAPLAGELAGFFYGAGVLVLEGYGLTETSPVITCNRPEKFRFGSVGIPIPGVEVKIAGDGEILTRGPHVMKGYFNNPQATAEVIDAEGWFHTGDIGSIDAEGFLTITDRKKDLIKTSGGKMVAPQNIENALKADPAIADCVVIGDKRKFISALIVPKDPKASHDFIWERVQKINQRLASFEQIKKITLLEPFTLQAGELTPTLKVKRRVIAERYADQIERMYRD